MYKIVTMNTVLDCIDKHSDCKRSDICSITGYTRTTVNKYVAKAKYLDYISERQLNKGSALTMIRRPSIDELIKELIADNNKHGDLRGEDVCYIVDANYRLTAEQITIIKRLATAFNQTNQEIESMRS